MGREPARGEAALQPRLDRLPTEVIGQILEHLVPEQPEPGETSPVEYDKMIEEEPWFDRTRRRAGLRSCCLVSRRVSAVALPLLYRTIFVVRDESLVQLVGTFLRQPHYGEWPRSLSVHLTLTDETVCRNAWRAAGALIRTMDADELGASERPAVRMLAGLRDRRLSDDALLCVPQALLFATLTFMSRLDSLLLQVPLTLDQDQSQYTALCDAFTDTSARSSGANIASNVAAGSTARPRSAIGLFQLGQPCPSLTKLLLQADPDCLKRVEDEAVLAHGGILDVYGCAAGSYWPIMAACLRLDTVELFMDDGNWLAARHPRRYRYPAADARLDNIRRLYLHDTFATPQQVSDALRRFPRLEVLYVVPCWSSENTTFVDPRDLRRDARRVPAALRRPAAPPRHRFLQLRRERRLHRPGLRPHLPPAPAAAQGPVHPAEPAAPPAARPPVPRPAEPRHGGPGRPRELHAPERLVGAPPSGRLPAALARGARPRGLVVGRRPQLDPRGEGQPRAAPRIRERRHLPPVYSPHAAGSGRRCAASPAAAAQGVVPHALAVQLDDGLRLPPRR